jgi:hypothetical protein
MKTIYSILLISLAVPACNNDRDHAFSWELEQERVELEQRLKLGEYRLGLMSPDGMSELDRLTAIVKESEQKLKFLRSDKNSLTVEVNTIEQDCRNLCESAIEAQRSKSTGLRFPSLTINDGRTFINASITQVDDAGVAIRHEHGAARLRYGDLSESQRALFGLEESSALAAEEIERREAIAYEKSIEQEMELIREEQERNAVASRNQESSREARSLMAATSRSTPETSALSKPATPFGTGSIYRRSYDSYRYRSSYRYTYYYPTTRNPYCTPRTYRSVVDNRVIPRIQY